MTNTAKSSEEQAIERFIAQRGVTKCPTMCAAELGESTPGWRRAVEYRRERSSDAKTHRRHQRALRRRLLGA